MPDSALQLRRFPILYQLNARIAVRSLGATATLADVDDAVLDARIPAGVDIVYLLGVWQTGSAGRSLARQDPETLRACTEALPDLTDDDICGSCFAVTGYDVHDELGGAAALAQLRQRLADRGISLMLDFVPNHTALDHPWVAEHPEYYVTGTDADLETAPANWTRIMAGGEPRVLAHGRDPYFPGWSDTLQLDYSSAAVQAAMTAQLQKAAAQCDGLRCDMAMLLLPDVFQRTWGRPTPAFWPGAIEAVRARRPDLVFMAEVYWDREYDLQQAGFDFTYDKRLYDRLVGDLPNVRGHLCADAGYQARSARFLENHDEHRAATVFVPGDRERATAVVTYLCPGLRFLHEGQAEGWRIRVPVQLCRGPTEPVDAALVEFDAALRGLLDDSALHDGNWHLLDSNPAWNGNTSNTSLLGYAWTSPDASRLRFVATVNLSDHGSQGYLPLPFADLAGRVVVLGDRLGPARYERDGDSLQAPGLYLDVPAWSHQVFEVA